MTDLGLNAIVLEKADIGRTDLLFLMFALFKDNCFFLFFFFLFFFLLFSFPFLAFLISFPYKFSFFWLPFIACSTP